MSHIKSRKHASPLPAVLGLAVAALPGLATAQQAAPQAGAAEQSLPVLRATGQRISEVKADESANTKLTAPLLDTPKSVTVIPAQVIQQTGSVSLADALRTAPGISFGGGEGGNALGDRPFVRGFDAQSSTFVDGLRDNAPASREVFNIESVEASKGPDSAYAGRGGAGGTIGLYTKKPQAEEFVSGSVGVGTDGYRRLTGDGNWRFGETAAFRLNVMSHENDIPGRDGPDNSRWGVAPSLAFGLGTPTKVVLSYYHLETDDTPDSGLPYDLPATFRAGQMTLKPTHGGDRENWYGLHDRDFREDRNDSLTFQLEHAISPTTKLRNVTRVSKSSMDYVWTQPDDSKGNIDDGAVYRRFNSSIRDIDAFATQTELAGEIAAAGVKHRYVVGAELSREKADNKGYVFPNNNVWAPYNGSGATNCANRVGAASSYVCTGLADPNPNDPWLGTLIPNPAGPTQFTTNTLSAYVFDTVELTPRWLVNAGLRLDRYRTSQLNPPATVNGVPNVRVEYEQDDNLVNGQLGVVFKPADNGSVYVSYGTSSTPAGSTGGQGLETQSLTVVNLTDLKPERNASIELGTKWDLLDSQLSLTAAVFRIDTRDARITDAAGVVASAGDKEAKGFEFGVSGNLTRAWQLFAGYTYLDAVTTEAGYVNVALPNATPVYRTSAAEGRQFPTTAKHSLSLWTTYKPVRDLTLGAGVFAQSEIVGSWGYASGSNGQTVLKRVVPGYGRIDAMAAYVLNPNLTLQLNVQNLTDKLYYSAASSPHYASVGAGRSAVLSANLKY